MLYLLGLGERVVGVSHECDYPPEIADKPRLTRSLVESEAASRQIDEQVKALSSQQSALYAIDTARLAALRPDLIVTQAQCDVCAVRYEDVADAVASEPALGNTRILALNPQSIHDVLADLLRVAEAVGDAAVVERAGQLKAEMEAEIESRRARASSLTPDRVPRVICLEWIDPPMVAANWMPQLIAWSGGEAGMTTPGVHSSYADWDAIVRYDPQLLVVMPCGFDLPRAVAEAQILPSRPGWNELSAVRGGRVFAVDGNAYFNRSGPRLLDSLEILGHLIQPDLFDRPRQPEAADAWRRLETRGAALVPM